jgi:hypothetical protein
MFRTGLWLLSSHHTDSSFPTVRAQQPRTKGHHPTPSPPFLAYLAVWDESKHRGRPQCPRASAQAHPRRLTSERRNTHTQITCVLPPQPDTPRALSATRRTPHLRRVRAYFPQCVSTRRSHSYLQKSSRFCCPYVCIINHAVGTRAHCTGLATQPRTLAHPGTGSPTTCIPTTETHSLRGHNSTRAHEHAHTQAPRGLFGRPRCSDSPHGRSAQAVLCQRLHVLVNHGF